MKYHDNSFRNDCKRRINGLESIQSHFLLISEVVSWPKGLWSDICDSDKNLTKSFKSVSGRPGFPLDFVGILCISDGIRMSNLEKFSKLPEAITFYLFFLAVQDKYKSII